MVSLEPENFNVNSGSANYHLSKDTHKSILEPKITQRSQIYSLNPTDQITPVVRNEYPMRQVDKQPSISKILTDASVILRQKSYLGPFQQRSHLAQILKVIKEQISAYSFIPMQQLNIFLQLFKTKISSHRTSKSLYADLLAHISKITASLQLEVKRTSIQKQQMSDLLFSHFEKFCQSNQKDIKYVIYDERTKNKKNIMEFVDSYREEYEHFGWMDAFAMAQQQLSSQENMHPQNEDYEEMLHLERTQGLGCIGCSPFFYMNMNLLSECNQTLLALGGLVSEINKNRDMLKEEICASLNSRGGCILFDTSCLGLKVVPRGDFITEKEKEQIQQQIQGIITQIKPRPYKEDIEISFIPMMKDPKENPFHLKQSENGVYFAREYIEGLYVLRLRVSPHCSSELYSFTQEGKQYFPIRTNSIGRSPKSIRMLTNRQIIREMKIRMQEQINNRNLSEEELFFAGSSFTDFDHVCGKPDTGLPITEKFSFSNATSCSSAYRYGSMLIADRANHTTICNKLKKYGINSLIEVPSFRHNFKNSAIIAIIRHDVAFDTLLTAISNPEFTFNVKTSVINITEFIQLKERSQYNPLPEDDFRSLQEWLAESHPKETLTLWKMRNSEKAMDEYYLKTESMESTLFMFMVLRHFDEGALMKNPRNWKQMSEAEKKEKMVKVVFRLLTMV